MKRKPLLSATQRPRTPYSPLRAHTVPDGRKVASKRACRDWRFAK